ncbi:putative FEN1-fatty acid elongase [Tilletiaria anomala UBC 951]|uniref:Elongation of fatty acids protein n=1 Tax=Tilletiaria anomala (strain ATCC 24038 / CBS 436.72 / UBC 951) TaxID=1037660 RepID=A0A066W5D7_TILAU|nr:putative FEN1-fatty acid elongase [Tilletiaria anomala UBC 951]KDN47753.1 putative FEN1-fatty acid elongase [Tilletiaria anomala UBC 951]
MASTPFYDFTISLFPVALRKSLPLHLLTWQAGVTPLSTLTSISAAIVVYLGTIFGIQALMRGRAPFGKEGCFKLAFLVHNVALTIGSALLLGCMLEEIWPIFRERGLFYAICGAGAWTMRMETFYIINFYFKFWELIDTIFLVLKKKPLQFLHVYHHSATALLCFSQLHGHTSVSWVVICLNLAVHVLMYFYYALTSLKIPCPWKKAVTTSQIVQFVIDLFVVYFASYNYAANTYLPWLPHVGTCAGAEYAAISGCVCLTSYLFLFIAFYQRTYKKAANARAKAAANGKALANGYSNGSIKKAQ